MNKRNLFQNTAVLPVSPVACLVDCKVRDGHVISLPGALVVRQVSPLDQVVINPLLVHAVSRIRSAEGQQKRRTSKLQSDGEKITCG